MNLFRDVVLVLQPIETATTKSNSVSPPSNCTSNEPEPSAAIDCGKETAER
jgi:hypothetical protein